MLSPSLLFSFLSLCLAAQVRTLDVGEYKIVEGECNIKEIKEAKVGNGLNLTSPVDPGKQCHFIFDHVSKTHECCYPAKGRSKDCKSIENGPRCLKSDEYNVTLKSRRSHICSITIRNISEANEGFYQSFDDVGDRIEQCHVTVEKEMILIVDTNMDIIASLGAILGAGVLAAFISHAILKFKSAPEKRDLIDGPDMELLTIEKFVTHRKHLWDVEKEEELCRIFDALIKLTQNYHQSCCWPWGGDYTLQRKEFCIWWLKNYLVCCWPWKHEYFKTSGIDDKIPYESLKKLIERLYNNRTNRINFRPVGAKWMENKDDEKREEFFRKLETYIETEPETNGRVLSFSKFRELMRQANTSKTFDSVDYQLGLHFKILAKGKRISLCPPPVFIPLLTIGHLLIFIYTFGEDEQGLGGTLTFHTDCQKRWWSYITYSLVHHSVGRFLFNMCLQLGVGLGLEMAHGFSKVGTIYTVGVLFSSLSFFCFDCRSLEGSTAGVYSLIGASFSTIVLNWEEDKALFVMRPCKGKVPLACGMKLGRLFKLIAVLLFWVFQIGYAAWRAYFDVDAGFSVISQSAGTIAGILLGLAIMKSTRVERGLCQQKLKIISLTLVVSLTSVAIGINISGWRGAAGIISNNDCPGTLSKC